MVLRPDFGNNICKTNDFKLDSRLQVTYQDTSYMHQIIFYSSSNILDLSCALLLTILFQNTEIVPSENDPNVRQWRIELTIH